MKSSSSSQFGRSSGSIAQKTLSGKGNSGKSPGNVQNLALRVGMEKVFKKFSNFPGGNLRNAIENFRALP
ncbi:MAG: hypothetical protein IKO14_01400 [Oscillibacter sp.]|nr:hypothetical protein [Oscillibacter sp.]